MNNARAREKRLPFHHGFVTALTATFLGFTVASANADEIVDAKKAA